jgi:hypothetical protein
MGRRTCTAFLAILAGVSQARAQAPTPAPPAGEPAPACVPLAADVRPVAGPPGDGRVWAEADFLLWWMRGAALPPLVTTSPAGTPISQAGVLGAPGTTILFGGSSVNDDLRAGGRIAVGYWFDCDRTCGVEADFFMLEGKAARFAASSGGDPILARPFTDASSGGQASQRIAFPGDTTGSVQAFDGTTGLLGAGALLRENLCCKCWCEGGFRLDVLFGYRYLQFSDRLGVTEDITNVNPNNPNFIPVGANIVLEDRFSTRNQMHALDFGLVGELRRGPLSLTARGRIAVGYDHQDVDIFGTTTVTVPGAAPVVNSGGLLALGGNLGHHSRDEAGVVPELDVKLAYQITPRLTASVGYTFLYWSDVVRAGDQIDQTVNSTLLPPAVAPSGPARPAFGFRNTDFWAQGLDLGLELRY